MGLNKTASKETSKYESATVGSKTPNQLIAAKQEQGYEGGKITQRFNERREKRDDSREKRGERREKRGERREKRQ